MGQVMEQPMADQPNPGHAQTGQSAPGKFVSTFVQEWMTARPYTCTPDTSLADVYDVMVEKGFRRMPVVDEEGRLVGIITFGDLRQAAPSSVTSLSLFEINYFWAKLTVKDAMTPDPVTLAPDDTIKRASQLMLEHKISGLPVVSGEKVVGILTQTDILHFLVSLL